jgi:hypothetical protein
MTAPSPIVKLGVEVVIGWVWQVTRGPKHIPNQYAYAILGVAAMFCWIWMTPNALWMFTTDWRNALAEALASIVSMLMVARGSGATSADAKMAPKTNSL